MEDSKGGEPTEVTLTVFLDGDEDQRATLANHFSVQHNQDEFILVVSQVCPPLIFGNEAEVFRQLAESGKIRGHVLGKFALTRTRMGELIDVLIKNVEKYDARVGGRSDVH